MFIQEFQKLVDLTVQTDFEKLVLQNNAGLLALKKNELEAYDQI